MSTASVSRVQQQTQLPHVVHRPPKQDFTYTFQKVAPVLFCFLLGLSIYTKYRMSTVVLPANEKAVQPYIPEPWEHPYISHHIELNIGEKRWAHLQDTLSNVKDVSQEAWDDVIDVGQSKWSELKEAGKDMWEGLKDSVPDTSSLKEKGQEFVDASRDVLNEKTEILKAKIVTGKSRVVENEEAGRRKVIEAWNSAKDIGRELEGKEAEIRQALSDAKASHTHTTDSHPAPSSSKPGITQAIKDTVKGLMESGAVYTSPAPYNGQCPVLGPDMCPASTNTTYTMWW